VLLAIVPALAEIAVSAPPPIGGLAFGVLVILTILCVAWIYGRRREPTLKRRGKSSTE
jgi:uncharacterized paraquat-inducible protein A